MSKYSVKIMGGHVQSKGTIASKISKSIHYSDDTNFKLMVIKKQKKTITVPQHGIVYHGTMLSCHRKQKELLVSGPDSTPETFHGLKQRNFRANDENDKESVVEIQATKVTTSLKRLCKTSK
jgi:hypothetical protein